MVKLINPFKQVLLDVMWLGSYIRRGEVKEII